MGLWPLSLVLIIFIFLEHRKDSVLCVKAINKEDGQGTVLFNKSFSIDEAWTDEELAIITSRKILQELIPKIQNRNNQYDQYIIDFYKYFHNSFKYVYNLSVGTTRRLLLKVFADIFGDYLNSQLIPVIKLSFYAGNVKYCNVKKITALFLELKAFLHTNGDGWNKPTKTDMEMKKFINETPIKFRISNDTAACNNLIIRPSTRSKKRNYRRRVCRIKKNKFISRHDLKRNTVNKTKQIQLQMLLPHLDNNLNPNSILLQFKNQTLWYLQDEESVSILIAYYDTCVNCLASMNGYTTILGEFNKDFYHWLLQSVYPRLNDDKVYPAFGGVLRIIAYLRKTVVKQGKQKTVENPKVTEKTPKSMMLIAPNSKIDTPASNSIILLMIIGISSIVFLWILIGCILYCCTSPTKDSNTCTSCDSGSTDVVTIFENNNFSDLDQNISRTSQKSCSEKIAVWCTEKLKTQSGAPIVGKDEFFGCLNKGSLKKCIPLSKMKTQRCRLKTTSSASRFASPCKRYLKQSFHSSTEISSSNSDSSNE